jgi:hypothetical protein
MVVQSAETINKAFDLTAPELKSQYARYPMKYARWLGFNEKYDGKPTFIAADTDQGFKQDYVYCKHAPNGKGYYHLLTKVSHVNLFSRILSEGAGAGCLCNKDFAKHDSWDTTRLVVYARTRCSRPDDDDAKEQGVDHYVGTKLNPVHGLKVTEQQQKHLQVELI